MPSSTQYSLKHLKDNGWDINICTWWEAHGRKRKDLWNFADLVGFHPDYTGTTYFQITSYPNIWARKKKILANNYTKNLLLCGNRIIIHGWLKKRHCAPILKEMEITLEDFK